MKQIVVVAAMLLFGVALNAAPVTKQGVLVTEACVKEGRFVECPLDTYTQDAKLVLFVHQDLKYYSLDVSKIPQRELDEGFARNGVEIVGEFDSAKNLIKATEYKAPPPPAASSFKG